MLSVQVFGVGTIIPFFLAFGFRCSHGCCRWKFKRPATKVPADCRERCAGTWPVVEPHRPAGDRVINVLYSVRDRLGVLVAESDVARNHIRGSVMEIDLHKIVFRSFLCSRNPIMASGFVELRALR
jgi:hypothetical protein